jgi:hypothetical protein
MPGGCDPSLGMLRWPPPYHLQKGKSGLAFFAIERIVALQQYRRRTREMDAPGRSNVTF